MEQRKIVSAPRNPNTPSAIRRRNAALRKQISKARRIANLLRREQLLRDELAMVK